VTGNPESHFFLTKQTTWDSGSNSQSLWAIANLPGMTIFLFVFLICTSTASAQTPDYPPYSRQNGYAYQQADPFQQWLRGVEAEAEQAGVSRAVAENALAQVSPDERVIERDSTQPEQTLTFATYREHIVTPDRVSEGRALVRQHAHLLKEISQRYGVPPEIIVALWGMESGFGRNIGGYNIVNSLATLAYQGRRANFFRSELINALKILDQEHMPASELRGSWAGAMGQCQFMPSTYLRYAVDYQGGGKRDIWHDQTDVFASIANYLAAEGWKPGTGWGRAVSLRKALPESETGLGIKHSLTEWTKRGVRDTAGKPLPNKPLQASLVQPDGPGGRSYLVYDNFRALMRWNRSSYFATSVGLLADSIR